MRNEEQTDRKETLEICAHFNTENYSSTLQDQHSSLKITNPDSSEVPPILTKEVKKNLERNEKQGPKHGYPDK